MHEIYNQHKESHGWEHQEWNEWEAVCKTCWIKSAASKCNLCRHFEYAWTSIKSLTIGWTILTNLMYRSTYGYVGHLWDAVRGENHFTFSPTCFWARRYALHTTASYFSFTATPQLVLPYMWTVCCRERRDKVKYLTFSPPWFPATIPCLLKLSNYFLSLLYCSYLNHF